MVSKKTLESLGFFEIVDVLREHFFCCENPQYFLETRPTCSYDALIQFTSKQKAIIALCSEQSPPQFLYTQTPFAELKNIKENFDISACQEIAKIVRNCVLFRAWLSASTQVFLREKDVLQLSDDLLSWCRRHFSQEGLFDETSVKSIDVLMRKKKTLIRNREKVAGQFIKRSDSEQKPTMAGNRVAIALPRSKKRVYDGVIHSYSNSGHTVFFEPKELFELNNQLELIDQEIRECIYIFCRECKSMVKHNMESLAQAHAYLLELDIFQAVERYLTHSKKTHAFPTIQHYHGEYGGTHSHEYTKNYDDTTTNDAAISRIAEKTAEKTAQKKASRTTRRIASIDTSISSDTHPLIELKQVTNPLIPDCQAIDICIATPITQCVITGANAGGKTATLKTLGLSVLLNQSGLPLQVEEGACLPLFSSVELVIGDQQDLAKGESHFSAHLDDIIQAITSRRPLSLLLIDEICSGTDAHEGAALACSILKHINDKHTLSLATTHLSLLKSYALSQKHIEALSVGMHEVNSYALTYGTIGKSEVARLLSTRPHFSFLLKAYQEFTTQFGSTEDEYIERLNNRILSFEQKTNLVNKKIRELQDRENAQQALQKELIKEKLRYTEKELEKGSSYLMQLKKRIREAEQDRQRILSTTERKTERKTETKKKPKKKTDELPEHTHSHTKIAELEKAHNDRVLEYHRQVNEYHTKPALHDIVTIKGFDSEGSIVAIHEDGTFRVQIGSLTLDFGAHMLTKVTSRTTSAQKHNHKKATVQIEYDSVHKQKQGINPDAEHSPLQNLKQSAKHPLQNTQQSTIRSTRRKAGQHSEEHRKRSYKKEISLTELDVRGTYLAEAILLIESHVNRALLDGKPFVSIIHGKGELGRGLKKILSEYPEITKIESASFSDGGDGKSYCYLTQ